VFGISFEELVILALLAFILFGPEKLPEYAQTLGRFVAKLREAGSEVTRQYQNPLEPSPETAPSPAPELESPSTCPYCQQKVDANFTFCTNCGHRLQEDHYPPAAPESTATCPKCQQEVDSNFTFCPICGHRLLKDHYPPPPQEHLAS
jgi:sec-independent protein translocase protein TatA